MAARPRVHRRTQVSAVSILWCFGVQPPFWLASQPNRLCCHGCLMFCATQHHSKCRWTPNRLSKKKLLRKIARLYINIHVVVSNFYQTAACSLAQSSGRVSLLLFQVPRLKAQINHETFVLRCVTLFFPAETHVLAQLRVNIIAFATLHSLWNWSDVGLWSPCTFTRVSFFNMSVHCVFCLLFTKKE